MSPSSGNLHDIMRAVLNTTPCIAVYGALNPRGPVKQSLLYKVAGTAG
jgi:hypothetical protein